MTAASELLALLKAVPNLNVHDGTVDADEAEKIIKVALPYVVLTSGVGEDAGERMGGRPGRRAVPFSTFYVGESPEQARWIATRSQEALSRRRITVDGRESGLIFLRESSEIRPERDYKGAGGELLFRGTDKYVVGV